jgi:peptide methionine sulfoxide reductase msrA/msrB
MSLPFAQPLSALIGVASGAMVGMALLITSLPSAPPGVPESAPPANSSPSESTMSTSPSATKRSSTDAPLAPGVHRYSASGYDVTPWTREQITEAAKSLPADVRDVVLNAGTEPPFCGQFTDNKQDGIYVCVVGGLPLFKSEHKFLSKSGWASFHTPFDPAHIIERTDRSHGMVRVEILDARTGAHLGHVFEDGPAPTGRRYCLNSAALKFIPKGSDLPPESQPVKTEVAYFAGGCFWGVEDAFAAVNGVLDVESGFAGGKSASVSYKEVCYGSTGHAEVVKVTFDPKVASYRELVKQFFRIHDATTLNRQGPDVGDQYRSAIFTTSDEQAAIAKEIIAKLGQIPQFQRTPIVTKVEPVRNYVRAEDYHQDYHAKNGGHCHIRGYQGEMPF